jgi:uncharacterized protein (DUF362 family)
MRSDVFVARTDATYQAFPYEGHDRVAAALDSLFTAWGRDAENPFDGWLTPGNTVVIKPNWVHHEDPVGGDLDALVTHSSLIKYVLDRAALALDGRGTIVIGDAPIQSCDFAALLERTRIPAVVESLRRKHTGLDVRVEDWRLTVLDGDGAAQLRRRDRERAGSNDYRLVDLAASSFLEDISEYADRFRVTCYSPDLMATHHRPGKHEYLVTSKVFGADLVVNLPKMKTHIKAGLTGALKNLVGINGHKEFLPHHIVGASERGGDCYYKPHALRDTYDAAYDRFWAGYDGMPEWRRKVGVRVLEALWRASEWLTGDSTATGSWFGNETVWRMTLDLNHLLYFADDAPKRVITIVDGIVAGEGDGPLRPRRKAAGLLVGGENPAYIDGVLARLMGYNVSRVPTAYHAIYHRKSHFGGPGLEEIDVHLCHEGRIVRAHALPNLDFAKPRHWQRAASPSLADPVVHDRRHAEQPA